MIDLHCDTLMKLIDEPEKGDLYNNPWKINIPRLQKGKYALQDFAIYIDLGATNTPFARYEAMRNIFYENMEKYSGYISHVRSYDDLLRCNTENKIGALLSIEEGGVLEGKIERLDSVYEDGVRLITISWNYPNGLSYPQGEKYEGQGLTALGRDFVARMEELGIIVDSSHLNDTGTYELLEICTKPFIASHSCARALKNHRRNLPDDLIKGIANKGGIIGLAFCKNFLGVAEHSYIEDMVKHVLYMYNLGGSELLAIGTDYDGTNNDIEVDNPTEMYKLYDALVRAGLSEDNVYKIFEGNARRILKELI